MTRPFFLTFPNLRDRAATALLAMTLTAPQATASVVDLPGLLTPRKVEKVRLTIAGLDYGAFQPVSAEELRQRLLDRQASAPTFVPPTPTSGGDEAKLYFEAELSFGVASTLDGLTSGQVPNSIAEALRPGQKISGSLTYKPTQNLFAQQVASDLELQGPSNTELDSLFGIGQYELSEARYSFGPISRTFFPNGALGPDNTAEEQRAARSVYFGNNTISNADFVAGAAIEQAAPILPTILNTAAYKQLLAACGPDYAEQGLLGAGITPDTRSLAVMTLGITGPDILPGNDRQPTQPIITQGLALTGNTFSLTFIEHTTRLTTQGLLAGTCEDLLREFRSTALLTQSYSAVGALTYVSPVPLNIPGLTPGVPVAPVAAVPVPPALGFGLTWLLMLGLARLRRKPA